MAPLADTLEDAIEEVDKLRHSPLPEVVIPGEAAIHQELAIRCRTGVGNVLCVASNQKFSANGSSYQLFCRFGPMI